MPEGSKRVNRFDERERKFLEEWFQSNKTPNFELCEKIAKEINSIRKKSGKRKQEVISLSGKQIKFWFDHRRRVENHGTYKPLNPGSRTNKAKKPKTDASSSSKDVYVERQGKPDSEIATNLPHWMYSFQLLPLMSTMKYRTYVPGAIIIEKGEYSDDLFFLLKGTVAIVDMNGTTVSNLSQGSYFGEMGVIDKGPRTATVQAVTHCHVFVMSGEVARDMIKNEPNVKREVYGQATVRLLDLLKNYETNTCAPLLIGSPSILSYKVYENNEVILKEGDLTDDFYFLSKGKVDVSKQGSSIAVLDSGSFFGEMAALCPGSRTTTIKSLTKCEVFVLPGQILRTLAADDPSLSNGIGETLRQVVFARACDTIIALTDRSSVRPVNLGVAVSTSTMTSQLKEALFQLLKCIHNVTASI